MTATLRIITRRANGRETTRTTEVQSNLLSIGRATDCDIKLPDLRIGLKHARVTISSGAFLIESEGDNEFKVNGRSIRKVETRLGAPLVVQFGPYSLTFSEEGGRLCIDVERVQQASANASDAYSDKIFSLRSTWLSKRAAAWALSLLVAVLFLAFPIATFALKPAQIPQEVRIEAGRLWSTGELSSPHKILGKDCSACHEQAFVAVRDETCVSCHENTNHHADEARMRQARGAPTLTQQGLRAVAATFNKPAGRCADCHAEHNGHDGLSNAAQTTCTSCHADMRVRLPDAGVGNASDFGRDHPEFRPTVVTMADLQTPKVTRQWSVGDLSAARLVREQVLKPQTAAACDGFAIGQPNFRGLPHDGGGAGLPARALPGDNSGLVFPHDVHLAANGCVAAIAKGLPRAAGLGDRLVCKDCHTPNESGEGFQPVSMERNCASCHSLVFDNAGGFERELRHGRTNDVIATLLDFYQARVVGAAVGGGEDIGRRRPGEAAVQRYVGFREQAFAQAGGRAATRVRAIFQEGGACYGCHLITPPARAGALDFKVAPVTLRNSFLPHGVFNHKAHELGSLDCKSCHTAETSHTSTDVMIPSIKTCQECHGGETARAQVQSSCVMCHGFHSTAEDAIPMRPVGAAGSRGAQKAGITALSRGTLR